MQIYWELINEKNANVMQRKMVKNLDLKNKKKKTTLKILWYTVIYLGWSYWVILWVT